ncbi:DUF1833 family protein [Lichenihabitans psoromatis]|uniref:DUF1833 family protein n=1 Tax=Lichenihabitans psoromatis TaxID=2528642 RepID=UPI0010385B32|nr:DUF1833 family protein [Lichenihabitans psoromatis]
MIEDWNAAWAEAQTNPSDKAVPIWSIELIHPAFIQNGQQISIRVTNDNQDQDLPLEDAAPLNPGETVTFLSVPFDTPWFEQRDGQVSSLNIRIDNVGRELMPYLDAAMVVNAALQVIFRCHLIDMATGVISQGMGPISVDLRQVSVNESYVEGVASPADLVNLQFLRVIYDTENYPALSQ